VIGGLIVCVTHASPGVAYLIAFGVTGIGIAIMFGPERVRLWRQTHGGPSGRYRRRR
jgi:hypothetical protein